MNQGRKNSKQKHYSPVESKDIVKSNSNKIKKKKKWRKILYEDQDYDDNYLNNSFLSSLLTTNNTKCRYSDVSQKMICVNHQITQVLFLLVAYYYIDKNVLSHKLVYSINILIILLKEILIYEGHKSLQKSFKNMIEALINIGIIWILSPVLFTLTQTHSDDTAYFVATLLLFIHLLFHDYTFVYEKNENINITDSTSLSCAVIASVILASRLSSIIQVFSFLFLSSILFFFFPSIVQCVSLKNINFFNYILVPILFCIVSLVIKSISLQFFFLNLIGQLLILFIVPIFFVEQHNLKTKLEGPWDICKISS